MGYSRMEMETTITWDDEEKLARVYTASPITMRKLDKLCSEFPGQFRCVWQESGGTAKKYEMSCSLVKFKKPASEARIQAARERAKISGFQRRKVSDEEFIDRTQ